MSFFLGLIQKPVNSRGVLEPQSLHDTFIDPYLAPRMDKARDTFKSLNDQSKNCRKCPSVWKRSGRERKGYFESSVDTFKPFSMAAPESFMVFVPFLTTSPGSTKVLPKTTRILLVSPRCLSPVSKQQKPAGENLTDSALYKRNTQAS